MFTGTESFLVNPIIDSAVVTSVIGEETLKEYCRILHLADLEKAEPMESTHRFGYYGKPISTLCSVFVQLPTQGHNVFFRTHLLPGRHSFLIGAETPERMRAVLNYGERKFSLKLSNKPLTVDLIKPDRHLLIPVQGFDPIFMTSTLEDIDFKKLHSNTGHPSFENIKKLLEHAGKWNN